MTNPVIETNIERILQDHLFDEVDKITQRMGELREQLLFLEARKEKLLRIAEAAGIESDDRSSTL